MSESITDASLNGTSNVATGLVQPSGLVLVIVNVVVAVDKLVGIV